MVKKCVQKQALFRERLRRFLPFFRQKKTHRQVLFLMQFINNQLNASYFILRKRLRKILQFRDFYQLIWQQKHSFSPPATVC